MKRVLKTLVIGVLFVVGLSACASTAPQTVMLTSPGPSQAELKADLDDHFAGFRKQTSAGNCGAAERHMRDLMENYQSEGSAWAATLLTDLCLCHIENGEVGRFAACSEELEQYTGGMKVLDRETQFVKQLSGYFSGYTDQVSLIDADIRNGFTQALGTSEEE